MAPTSHLAQAQAAGLPAFRFDNSYARLPDRFYASVAPQPASAPRLLRLNHALAEELGLDADALDSADGAAIFAGNVIPQGAQPIALAYAGHQFGGYSPRLGDGRAMLLGEVLDRAGRRRDVQLKGSGRTPFSRGGDGRSALGPVLREYVVSEAMHALGVPTTRALAAVATGDQVARETMLPGAVLTRVAASHIRIGTFQYFAAAGDRDGVRILADYTIERHYPELLDVADPYLRLFEAVRDAQARLVARWMAIGFIHGVMNTDNMTVSGETIDYGPCAFMDSFDPATVFSAIDEWGRYAYVNQPRVAPWNLARLAETLAPLVDDDVDRSVERLGEALVAFPDLFRRFWLEEMRAKIGLARAEPEDDALVEALLAVMHEGRADYTLVFRALGGAVEGGIGEAAAAALFGNPQAFGVWAQRWRARLARENRSPVEAGLAMRRVNPAFIPRNHLVEQMIAAAVERDDFTMFDEMLVVLARPFREQPLFARYAEPPRPGDWSLRTTCGT
ncbi:MAG: YdiU family protein [Microvirga sp.]|nr:YdiU family protein [Microvirga sp.]